MISAIHDQGDGLKIHEQYPKGYACTCSRVAFKLLLWRLGAIVGMMGGCRNCKDYWVWSICEEDNMGQV
jgi:hypothetical protein